MAINLHDKWAKKADRAFTTGSLLRSRLKAPHDFSGVKTVRLSNVITKAPVDYNRGNIIPGASAYGSITEAEDWVQEMSVTQDKAWALKIDKGNAREQDEEKSAALLFAAQLGEQDIPLAEKYGFGRLLQLAGKVLGSGTAVTADNILERIDDGLAYQRARSVPEGDKTIFLDSARMTMFNHARRAQGSDSLVNKAWSRGKVSEYNGCDVVLVPDDRWPTFVNFMIVSAKSACMPYKLNEAATFEGGGLFSGIGLKSRYIFDCFVVGIKADGVYVDVETGSGKMTKVATPTIAAATGYVTCSTAGATIKATVDGTDPRYSNSAVTVSSGAAPAGAASGAKIRAYAYKTDCAPSDVGEGTMT